MKKEDYFNLVHIFSILFLVYLTLYLNNKFITLVPSLAFVLILKHFKKKGKKAQAAMEFLTTYGWAILILIIVVVALANFGVFGAPDQPNFCSVSAPFACVDVKVCTQQSTNINMISNITVIANNVATWSLSPGSFIPEAGTCTGVDFSKTPFNGNGQMQVSLICPAGARNSREKGSFDIIYQLVGGFNPHSTKLSYIARREDDCGLGGGQSSGSGNIYQESLEWPWYENLEEGESTVTWQVTSPEPVHSGTYSAKVIFEEWGDLYLVSGPNWNELEDIDPTQYSAIAFWIYPLQVAGGQPQFNFIVYAGNNIVGNFPGTYYGTANFGEWSEIIVPMSQINPANNNIMHFIVIQNEQQLQSDPWNGLPVTAYIDEYRFVP